MAVGKFRFWWEGRKAGYRRWSTRRVIRSERARLESEVAGLRRLQKRNNRRTLRRARRKRTSVGMRAKAASLRIAASHRVGQAAASAMPRAIAVHAASRIWDESCKQMPEKSPRTITFHEGLLLASKK